MKVRLNGKQCQKMTMKLEKDARVIHSFAEAQGLGCGGGPFLQRGSILFFAEVIGIGRPLVGSIAPAGTVSGVQPTRNKARWRR